MEEKAADIGRSLELAPTTIRTIRHEETEKIAKTATRLTPKK